MKNICFTIRNIDCGGGTERVGLRLANALARCGYNVHMVSYDAKKNYPFFPCDVQIKLWCILNNIFHRRFRWQFWYGAYRFRRYLKKNKVDVVIDIDTFNALWTWPAIKGTGIKWISWDHFNFDYCINNSERIKALRLIEQHANRLVLLTDTDRATYLGKTSLKPEFVKRIYNPLSFEEPAYVERQGKKVLAIGRIAPQKGFDLLLQSWLIVEQEVKDWQLEIVCGYGDYNALQQEAETMGLKNVSCTPPTQDVKKKFTEAGIYALSSRFEGFGLVLTEASTMSVPMVAFDCPVGPNEIIQDGENGLLVEPENVEQFAEKLIYLIKNDDIRRKMGKRAFEMAKRFSVDTILPQWIEMIENL